MKRSPPPRRRQPLVSRGWAGQRRAKLARRAPIRSAPKRRTPAEVAIREAVFARDGGCLLAGQGWHRCYGPLTPHHLRKEGQGGLYTLDNLVALCSSGNDGWVEGNPNAAREMGLLVSAGDTTGAAWERMAAAGLVYYGPDGGPLGGASDGDV